MARRLKVKRDTEYTVSELMEVFLAEKKADGRAEKTLISYRDSFKKFLSCFGGDTKIDTIDNGTIIHYKNYLDKGETLHLASKNHYLRDLRSFIKWCQEDGYIAERIEVKLIKGQEEPIETYTDEELEKLLAPPDKKAGFVEWRTWTIVNWILAEGSRIETIVNIRIGDIHFGRDEILIREQKNKKATTLPLAKALKNVLRTYIKKCRSNATDNSWLFCNIEDEKLTTKALQSSLYDYNRKRGVNRTSAHALRHTFAKQYILNGGEAFRLQKILGHSQLEMTRHYVNLFGVDLKKDYDDVVPLNTLAKPRGRKKQKVMVSDE